LGGSFEERIKVGNLVYEERLRDGYS
jgi:hypothetical protein